MCCICVVFFIWFCFFVGLFVFHKKVSQVLFATLNRITSGLKPEYCNIMLSVFNALSNESRNNKGIGLASLKYL